MGTLDVFEFLDRIVALIKSENILRPSSDEKLVDFLPPEDLKKQIKFDLTEKCTSLDELEALCKEVIKYSIKTNNRNFHNQLYGATDLFGLAATWLSESLNTNQHTFEVAPVFSLIEQTVIEQVISLLGYKEGDGIFSPGGSVSNMYAMTLARFKKFPQIKTKGLSGLPTLVAFTSEAGHYSLDKAVNWLGIGTDNLIKIKTDHLGKMIPAELEKAVVRCKEEGLVPFFVNATAGTTVLGAMDPFEQLADICEKHQLWFHVDACYGGTFLLSHKYKKRLAGSNRSDSFAWNPHKMLGVPLQCSIFITRHNNILHECNSASATYLFQQDKFYNVSYDTGNKSIQCGRKVDSFKLWVMWKARGLSGFDRLIHNAMDVAFYLKLEIQKTAGFKLVLEYFESSAVCFWYIPKKLRGIPETDDWWEKINKVAPAIKERMTKKGTLMIGYQPLNHKGLCNFFRMIVTCHPLMFYSDMDYVIKQIVEFGDDL